MERHLSMFLNTSYFEGYLLCHLTLLASSTCDSTALTLAFSTQLFHISSHREQHGIMYHITEAEQCSHGFGFSFFFLFHLSLPLLYHSLMSGRGIEAQKVSKQGWSEDSEKHCVCRPHRLTSGSSNLLMICCGDNNDF